MWLLLLGLLCYTVSVGYRESLEEELSTSGLGMNVLNSWRFYEARSTEKEAGKHGRGMDKWRLKGRRKWKDTYKYFRWKKRMVYREAQRHGKMENIQGNTLAVLREKKQGIRWER